MELPEISSYGDYSNNYGVHTLQVTLPWLDLTLYYSYKTLVAFKHNGRQHVRENVWGRTTGKHLNWIDNKRKQDRISEDEFNKRWQEMMAGVTVKELTLIIGTTKGADNMAHGMPGYSRELSLTPP